MLSFLLAGCCSGDCEKPLPWRDGVPLAGNGMCPTNGNPGGNVRKSNHIGWEMDRGCQFWSASATIPLPRDGRIRPISPR